MVGLCLGQSSSCIIYQKSLPVNLSFAETELSTIVIAAKPHVSIRKLYDSVA